MEVASSNHFNRPSFPLSQGDSCDTTPPSIWAGIFSGESDATLSESLFSSSMTPVDPNSQYDVRPIDSSPMTQSVYIVSDASSVALPPPPPPTTVVTAPSSPAYDSSSMPNGAASKSPVWTSPASSEAPSDAQPAAKGLNDGSPLPHSQGAGSLPSSSEKQVSHENAESNTPLPTDQHASFNQQQYSAFRGPTSATGSHNSFPNHSNTQRSSGCNWGRRHQQFRRGNQDWNINTSFNGRDMRMPPRGVSRFARPSPPPPFPSAQYFDPPLPSYRPTTNGFSEVGPHFPYYAAPPTESPPPVPYVPPIPPYPMNVITTPNPELSDKILRQIEYYFSFDNLIKDIYLRKQMDDQGWVSIRLIAGFPKMKKLTDNIQMIRDALEASSVVEISGEKIRRREDWERWIIPDSCQLPTYRTSSN